MTVFARSILPSALALVVLTGCAKDKADDAAPATSAQKPSYFEEQTDTATATVEAINHETREVTLKNRDGESISLTAGPEVKNLDKVKVGDRVEADYYESVAVRVLDAAAAADAGTADVDVRQAVARTSEPGEKPAGVATQHVTVNATIEKIDKKKQTVTLRGPAGKARTVKVRDPKKLEALKVGDVAVITYTEALAVAIRPAP